MGVHELCHAGIVFHVEQGEPGVGLVQIAYDVARSLQGTARRTSLRNQEGLRGGVGDHRFTRQPVGEICDRCEGHAVIEVEIMDEFHGLRGERIVERNLSDRLGHLPYWLCNHHLTPFAQDHHARPYSSRRGGTLHHRLGIQRELALTPSWWRIGAAIARPLGA